MDIWTSLMSFLLLTILSEADGFRFKYYKRYRASETQYTLYAYSNYISYSPNQGWLQSSSYVKYVPDARDTETYKFYRGTYTPHIKMYYSMASSNAYKNRRIPEDALVCTNYDANDNGDVMGIFSCPNAWEPSNFTSCCGQDYAEFCCDQSASTSNWVTIVASVAGIVAAIIIIIIVIVMCRKKKRDEKQNPAPTFSSRLGLRSESQSTSQSRMPEVKMQYPRSETPLKEDSRFAYSTAQ